MGEQGVLPEAAPEGSQEILHHLLDPPAELCYFLVDELPVEELVLGFDVPEGMEELLGSDVGMGFFGGQMLFAMVFTVGGFLGAFDGFAELGDDAVVGVAEDEELVGVEVLEVVGVVLEVHLYDQILEMIQIIFIGLKGGYSISFTQNQFEKMATSDGFNLHTKTSTLGGSRHKDKLTVNFKESKPAPFSRTFHSEWRDKVPKPMSFQDDDDYVPTAEKISKVNFQHHDPELCVCESCNCGRHLCKLQCVKPTLHKESMYKNSYPKKKVIPNLINHDKEYQKLEGPHIGMDSSNRKDYIGREGDKTERPKPEDLLKTGGPSPNLTSYSSGFPGYKGDNQYVKPQDKQTRANFPLMSRTTYSNSFSSDKPTVKPIKQRLYDNLKPGSLWLGQTSYGKNYQQPNPEDFAKKVKQTEKREDNPRFGRQYETTYKNNFLGNGLTVCPAKVKLETKMKGGFSSVKDRFTENSDFKALSPDYHAISTSKHSYV